MNQIWQGALIKDGPEVEALALDGVLHAVEAAEDDGAVSSVNCPRAR